MKEPQPQLVRIQLMDDFTTPEIEELERQVTHIEMTGIMVLIPLVVLSIICITLPAALQQMWIGWVGLFLWAASLVACIIWARVITNIYVKIFQAEEELLEQMVKERENSK